MAYKNGTYIAFHADDTPDPTESDMKYYNIMKMWKVREDNDFYFINSHEKTGSVRDDSKKETLRRSLVERLNNSKNMVLIIGETTWQDTDWVPFEIAYAIDHCSLPIIAAYTMYSCILAPNLLNNLWPKALADRITNHTAHVIHIPFKKEPLADALSQFRIGSYPL
ncbi:MAG TPA: TIR domain-containing protein [Anaerolineaceae bacterium]|nr:TIR domain-containing protein [Anaerolineaceae bacterium]